MQCGDVWLPLQGQEPIARGFLILNWLRCRNMSPHGKFYVQYSPLTAWSHSGPGSRFWTFPHDKLRVLLYCWVLPWTVGINCCRGTPAFTPGCWKTTPGWPTSRRGLLDCSRIIFKKGVVSCKNKTTEIVGKKTYVSVFIVFEKGSPPTL